ncbi:tRNA (adenine-N1)-methyltransferase [Humidisolicoccus flavus]|uniref:tRNA (adenine-N1)-methyltransferase n=1 Tax=Humidisolicoccus flavus TaxID=3111414 RepID=UPI0032536F04
MNARRGPFTLGDAVQLTSQKNKLHTIILREGGVFHTHRGTLAHEAIVGLDEGSVLAAGSEQFLALRPHLRDYVMSMPRGAAIIYPKDASHILAFADIQPGLRVVEAGVGSGALSLWLLRALAGSGELFSFERREEFGEVAAANVRGFLGENPENWTLTLGDLQDELPRVTEPGSVDRVLLDMLAPWECVEETAEALTPGGLVLCYIATVTQLSRTVEAFRASGKFTAPLSSETLVRGWHVEGLAVRPDHRMVAHTGFLMTARRLADGAVLPAPRRRTSKSEYGDEDVELWTPGSLGERSSSDKRLRRAARDAKLQADRMIGDHEE